jgi:septum formation protein
MSEGGLILASRSTSRRAMLEAAGVAHKAIPADIDERAVEAAMTDAHVPAIAMALSSAKAEAVAAKARKRAVLGSDSLVVVEGRRFDKPGSREEAADHLRFFSGRRLNLYAGAALALDGMVVWQHAEHASLVVRELSETFIARYLDAEWPEVAACVGVFRIEALGVQLFERIEGSHFTILGMPLLPVLAALRRFEVIAR